MRSAVHALVALVALAPVVAGAGCAKPVDWTCDDDAHESRPLSEPDASIAADGAVPSAVCQDTCGAPVQSCSFTRLEGGTPAAVCPVCTF